MSRAKFYPELIIENEYHAIFICSKYNNLRDAWLNKLSIPENFHELGMKEKLSLVLNKPENVRLNAQCIDSIFYGPSMPIKQKLVTNKFL